MRYIELEIEVITFTNVDVITSSCKNLTDWEKREREEELEDDYDEYEGILDQN